MGNELVCVLCEKPFSFRWSDTHGVGADSNCGMPYTIYHYADDGKRLDKGPEPVPLKDGWLEVGRRYHKETGRIAFPGAFDMGVLGSGYTYSGASADDILQWREWLDAHKAELPANDTAEQPK